MKTIKKIAGGFTSICCQIKKKKFLWVIAAEKKERIRENRKERGKRDDKDEKKSCWKIIYLGYLCVMSSIREKRKKKLSEVK